VEVERYPTVGRIHVVPGEPFRGNDPFPVKIFAVGLCEKHPGKDMASAEAEENAVRLLPVPLRVGLYPGDGPIHGRDPETDDDDGVRSADLVTHDLPLSEFT